MPVPHGGQGLDIRRRATYAKEQGARELNRKRLAEDFEVKGLGRTSRTAQCMQKRVGSLGTTTSVLGAL
jgi:hypothetical protein